MRHQLGLRLKFNMVLAPLVAAATVGMVWIDYRHEVAAIMASHALHSTELGTAGRVGPLDPATLPESVARESLRIHLVYAVLMLALLAVSVNTALHAFVLRPIERIRERIVKMERGHWRDSLQPAAEDEVGRLLASFQVLGLEIDALVAQLLRAERLTAIALISKKLESHLEPDLRRAGEIAAQLQREADPSTHDAGEELARTVASMLTVLRSLDRAFPRADIVNR